MEEVDAFLKKAIVQEAIYIASPDFYQAIQKYLKSEIKKEKEVQKIRQTAYKYLNRMMNRPTPFGLFAACSVANWDEITSIQLPLPSQIQRKPRVEVTYLATLMEQLTTTNYKNKPLSYQLNDTIYQLKEKITYIKVHDLNGKRTPAIEVAKIDQYLSLVLKETKNHAKLSTLVQKLQQLDEALTPTEIYSYLEELINAQILVNEWLPNITGLSYFQKILKDSSKKESSFFTKTTSQLLQKINQLSTSLTTSKSTSIKDYQQLYATLQQLQPRWPAPKALQLDAFKIGTTNFKLTHTIQNNLLEAVKFLTHFRPPPPHSHLTIFKKKFTLRYEKQAVPLLELMDASIGLGYPIKTTKASNFLLANLPITIQQSVAQEQWQSSTKILHQLLVKATQTKKYQVDLTEFINFRELTLPDNLPPSKSLVFSVIGEVDKVPQIYMKYLGASSAANLISRFAHGHPAIAQLVQEIGAYEATQQPAETILAEVVHFPEFGAGNLLSRPAFRNYEIPYLCQSGLPKNQQLPLADLTVSLINDEWVLRSKKLNKVVIPKLSNSHDFHKNVHPVYRFLGDLQYRSRASSRLFSWGLLQPLFSFFPRIFYKNIILARACWRLKKAQFPATNQTAIKAWQKQWQIPRFITFGHWDKELVIDLRNPFAVELFFKEVKKRKEVLFHEVIFDAKNCPIKDLNQATYRNEFIATILSNNSTKPIDKQLDISQIKNINPTTQRSFSPGSNWVYFKVYGSTAAANSFLLTYFHPFLQHFSKTKVIANSFFIRYRDDFDHLRIRVLLNNSAQLGGFMQAMQQLIQRAKQEKLVWKLQLDTYDRELERYGSETMSLSEAIFGIDTRNVLQVLQLIKETGNQQLYWQFGVLAIQQYLEFFPLEARKKLATDLIKRLGNKFNLNQKGITLKLNKKYRKIRPELFQLFQQEHKNSAILAPILAQRSTAMLPYLTQLKVHFSTDFRLMENNALRTLMTSFIHLTINRLYHDQQPYNEFVLYYLLEKQYTSMIALEMNKN